MHIYYHICPSFVICSAALEVLKPCQSQPYEDTSRLNLSGSAAPRGQKKHRFHSAALTI